MRVLLTGNKGYIGYIMTDTLLKEGHQVIGYDRGFFTDEPFGRKDAYENAKNVKQIKKDIRDVADADMNSVDAVIHMAADVPNSKLQNVDAVVHLAGLPNDTACDLDERLTLDINYHATIELAKKAKANGVKRFIFSSSASVYGAHGEELISEDSEPKPVTIYAKSKLLADNDLLKLNSDDFSVTCMRNATCYGVSPRMRFDMVLNSMVGYAYTQNKIMLHNNGLAWRPVVHIMDVANAFNQVLDANKTKVAEQIFIVGSETVRIIDIANMVKKYIPKAKIIYESHDPDPRSYRLSTTKLKKAIGFKPKYNIDYGIKELLKAYKAYGLNAENFQNETFWAAKHYKYLLDSGKVDADLRPKGE